MEGSKNDHIYVIFSNTQGKMGRFIRAMTHGTYNHVSIALNGDLSETYSFARLKHDTPFCGGFVREGAERYRTGEHAAQISVCAIHVGEAGAEKVRGRIKRMRAHPEAYVYNMLSAMLAPWHMRVSVRDSYTCVEFAVAILQLAGVRLPGSVYSAAELYDQLCDHEVYQGEYPKTASVADQSYRDRVSIPRRVTSSVKQLGRLVPRLIEKWE